MIKVVNPSVELWKQDGYDLDSIFKHINDDKVFNIIFVDKDEIQRINREYRNIDRVTDVISFVSFFSFI